jgi:hypothetical protein
MTIVMGNPYSIPISSLASGGAPTDDPTVQAPVAKILNAINALKMAVEQSDNRSAAEVRSVQPHFKDIKSELNQLRRLLVDAKHLLSSPQKHAGLIAMWFRQVARAVTTIETEVAKFGEGPYRGPISQLPGLPWLCTDAFPAGTRIRDAVRIRWSPSLSEELGLVPEAASDHLESLIELGKELEAYAIGSGSEQQTSQGEALKVTPPDKQRRQFENDVEAYETKAGNLILSAINGGEIAPDNELDRIIVEQFQRYREKALPQFVFREFAHQWLRGLQSVNESVDIAYLSIEGSPVPEISKLRGLARCIAAAADALKSLSSNGDTEVASHQSIEESDQSEAISLTADGVSSADNEIIRLKILGQVDSGLYGIVYRALQMPLEREVAVKVIRRDMPNAADAMAHAKALIRAGNHPSIVTVHNVEEVSIDGYGKQLAIVMEWIDGQSFGKRLAGPRFTAAEALRICNGVLDGMERIHESGIPHGDLHWGNVMLLSDCTPKIIDIEVNSHVSFGQLSTMSRGAAIQADIDYCRIIVFKAVSHTDILPSKIQEIDEQLQSATTIDAMRRIVNDVLVAKGGEPSAHQRTSVESLVKHGLNATDAMVLKCAGDEQLSKNHNGEVISVPGICERLGTDGISEEQVLDAVELLHDKGFITGHGRFTRYFQLTTSGFDAYLTVFVENYDRDFGTVCKEIVNTDNVDDRAICSATGIVRPIVLHVIDHLESMGLVNASHTSAGSHVYHVAVELRRKLKELSGSTS